MSQYPIVLIPPAIQEINSAQPSVSTFAEPLPQQPGLEPKKVNTTLIAVEAAVAVLSVAIISQVSSVPQLLLFLVALGVIAIQAWRQFTTYPQRLQEHRCQVANYHVKLKTYKLKKQHYEEEAKTNNNPEQVAEFRYKLLLQVLSQTVPHDGNGSRANRGWAEKRFGNHLIRYFPNKIHTGLTLKIPSYKHPYTPDFAYIDSFYNLHIDIEVDEPYIYDSGDPTHFLGAWKDSNRNNFFVNKGWIVIRFSEEQVVRWSDSCCKTICQVIAQVTGDTSTLNQFIHVPDLQPIMQWTEQEAREMAASGYRDKYLHQTNNFTTNPSRLIQLSSETKQQLSEPLPSNTTSYSRAQRRGATRAAKRTLHLSISSLPNTVNPYPLSLLVNCPYCGVRVRSTRLSSHKLNKCPKRPAWDKKLI